MRSEWWAGLMVSAGLCGGCHPPADSEPPMTFANPPLDPDACGDACGVYERCVEHFPIADRPGPPTHSCEQVCSFAGEDCQEGQYCAMESSGVGFVCRSVATPQIPPDIARVVELAEIWSLVRFTHPWLAYRDIDWGAALREAIPAAREAESDEVFRDAVGQMLATIGDPATLMHPPPSAPPLPDDLTPARDVNGTLVVLVDQVQPFNPEAARAVAEKIAKAERIVFDLRRWPSIYLDPLEGTFETWNPQLIGDDVTLPSRRHRVFHGFPTETGMTSGGYYEAFESSAGTRVIGERRDDPPKVAFVVGETQVLPAIALPLWESGRGVVVAETPLSKRVMASTIAKPLAGSYYEVRVGEVNDRGSPVMPKADVVTSQDPIARARALLERRGKPRRRPLERRPLPQAVRPVTPKPAEALPDAVHRMHAAIDLWSTLDVFQAYPNVRPRWDDALARALGEMDAADTWDAYARVMLTLNASVDDGHSLLSGTHIKDTLGPAHPPFSSKVIQGCLVVTMIDESSGDATPLRVGDVIMEIDGAPFSRRFDELAPLVAASTPAAHRNKVAAYTLQGPADRALHLKLDRDGETVEVSVRRGDRFVPTGEGPAYRLVLGDSIGVVELARLTVAEVPAMFEAMAQTEGIIFDMRGYPKGTAWAIAPYLDRHPGPTPAARFLRPFISHGEIDSLHSGRGTSFVQTLPQKDVERYESPTVMLIDHSTQSQAEHTGLFLEAANGTHFVGTPTSGANGDVTSHVLPDGTIMWFTGQSVTAASGRPLQRVGLPPLVRAEPTIAGIRAGRDEVLEQAVDLLVPPEIIDAAE